MAGGLQRVGEGVLQAADGEVAPREDRLGAAATLHGRAVGLAAEVEREVLRQAPVTSSSMRVERTT